MKRIERKLLGGLLLLSLAFAAPSCKQDTDDLIMAASNAGLIPAVYQSLTARFPNATNINGRQISDNHWLATFNEGSTARMSLLSNTGAFLDGEQAVPVGAMPVAVNTALTTDLPGSAVQTLTVVQQNGLITGWRINCTDSNAAAHTYLISPTGTIIEKR